MIRYFVIAGCSPSTAYNTLISAITASLKKQELLVSASIPSTLSITVRTSRKIFERNWYYSINSFIKNGWVKVFYAGRTMHSCIPTVQVSDTTMFNSDLLPVPLNIHSYFQGKAFTPFYNP